MAQPPRRVASATESRRRNMESSAHSTTVNGVASVKPKVLKQVNSSPYSQSVSCASNSGHEMNRRTSQKEKPALPAKPASLKSPPHTKPVRSDGTAKTTVTTTVHSKSQSHAVTKKEVENRVNGADVKTNGDLQVETKPSSAKGKVCVEIVLEKKTATPTSVRRRYDRELTHSSSEDSSPLQSPSKSVQFKGSRSSSFSSTDSKDRFRPGLPRYQSHTKSSSDKVLRAKSATTRTGSGSETSSDSQVNGSFGSTDPIKRGRARSMGPIRRVRSNEMMPIKKDLSPPSKSGTITSAQVRSKSVERSKKRQSFGGFVQRQRQAWEERVTTVTKRLSNLPERSGTRKSVETNHAPKIMQKQVTVTERKHLLFGKGASVQKVKTAVDENQKSKQTSSSSRNQSDSSHQVPKTKSSHSDVDRPSTKTNAHRHVPGRGNAQGDGVSKECSRTSTTHDIPTDKPSVLQEIAPSQSSKPNAPSTMSLKQSQQHADHRVSTSKENDIGALVLDVDLSAQNGTDEIDNAKQPFIITENPLNIYHDNICKQQSNDHDLQNHESCNEIVSQPDTREINKINSEAHQGSKKAENTFAKDEVQKEELKKDKVKEQEKAGISNGVDVGEKDGHYFLRVVNEEQSRIEALCRKVEDDLEGELPEDASGICRAFLGKANLLTSKKFKQFRGLCEENITKTPSAESSRITTGSDLAGFWDMVLIQVDDIHTKFIDIESMKQNDWKLVSPPKVSKPTPQKTPGKKPYGRQLSRDKDKKAAPASVDSNKNENSRAAKLRAAREEARKKMIEAKKKAARQRIRSSNSETEVEIFTASGPSQ